VPSNLKVTFAPQLESSTGDNSALHS